MRVASNVSVEKELEMAPWAKAEQRKKMRAELRTQLFCHVRLIFVVLFFAAIFVFIFNHQVEIKDLASAKLHQVIKHGNSTNSLRAKALKYEKEVDQVGQ
jgi:hypothetical protein